MRGAVAGTSRVTSDSRAACTSALRIAAALENRSVGCAASAMATTSAIGCGVRGAILSSRGVCPDMTCAAIARASSPGIGRWPASISNSIAPTA